MYIDQPSYWIPHTFLSPLYRLRYVCICTLVLYMCTYICTWGAFIHVAPMYKSSFPIETVPFQYCRYIYTFEYMYIRTYIACVNGGTHVHTHAVLLPCVSLLLVKVVLNLPAVMVFDAQVNPCCCAGLCSPDHNDNGVTCIAAVSPKHVSYSSAWSESAVASAFCSICRDASVLRKMS